MAQEVSMQEQSLDTIVEKKEEVIVLDEIVENNENTVKYIGQCKWFSDKLGYGFLTVVSDGDKKGTDIFAHHSGIKPLNSNYRTLKKGEYVEFAITNGMNGLQAVNIRGVTGGALMCDFITPKKVMPNGGVVSFEGRQDEWQQVPHKKSYHGGVAQPPPPPPRKRVYPSKYQNGGNRRPPTKATGVNV